MRSFLRKFEWKHKNNKFLYYTIALCRELWPASFFRKRLFYELQAAKNFNVEYVRDRVNYYNKLSEIRALSNGSMPLSELKITKKQSTYYFDSHEYVRYFNPTLRANFLFGDITIIPQEPSILKSRPIHGNNECSVLFKLNKVRHFTFTNDRKEFQRKRNMLVGRSVVKQKNRIRFYEKYFNHPLCDLGQINRGKNEHWIKDRLTIDEHLNFKFILCLEGYDVATNLKWVMSSNSVAVMPKPKYETWFMEGRLVPNYHYIQLKDDYSDLEERLNYYIQNTDEALRIIKNANAYVDQFKSKKREDLISLLVLEKYFYRTGQLEPISDKKIFEG